jgi:hypothetical protein
VLGTRTYRNTMELLSDFQTRGTLDGNQILITTKESRKPKVLT